MEDGAAQSEAVDGVGEWDAVRLGELLTSAREVADEQWAERAGAVLELPATTHPVTVAYNAFLVDLEAVALTIEKRLEGPCWKLSRSMLEVSLQLAHFAVGNPDDREELGAMIVRQSLRERRQRAKDYHRYVSNWSYSEARQILRNIRLEEASLQARLDARALTPRGFGSTEDLLDIWGHHVDRLVWRIASGATHGLNGGSFESLRTLGTGHLDDGTFTLERRPWGALVVYALATATLSVERAEVAMEAICAWPKSRLFEHVRDAAKDLSQPID